MSTKKRFLLCVDNRGYEASLEKRKLYEVLVYKVAEKHHQRRVVDESGDDYLYPAEYFAPVRLPALTKERLESTSVLPAGEAESQTMSKQPVSRLQDDDMQAVPATLLRAARRAREIARQTGTAVVVMRDGKLVKERQAVPEPTPPRPSAS